MVVAGDVNIIPDYDLSDTYLGWTSNIGLGTPGVEFHLIKSKTTTREDTRINLFSLAEEFYKQIMRW